MPRSLWTGTIAFGLVSVPVQMFTATASKELAFHFLDRRDMSPIGYDKINKTTGKHVEPEQVIRGFEVEKGRFVELSQEDIDRLDIELTHTIDICEFVSIDEIDPLFFRKAYSLLPQDGAEKPYRLLLDALSESGRVAIAKVVIRDKEHLACVRPARELLMLETMYYADELVLPDAVTGPALREPERKMARSLIDNLTAEWKPEKYHDRYRNELLDLLKEKEAGTPPSEPASAQEGQVIDLMDALRRSVQATKPRSPSAATKRAGAGPKAASPRRSTRKAS